MSDSDEKREPWEHVDFVTVTHTLNNDSPSSDDARRPTDATAVSTSFGTELGRASSNAFQTHLGQSLYETKSANYAERGMSFLTAIKLYPKAMAWSACLSLTIVMEGYGNALINSFFAFPQFQKDFGVGTSNWGYQIKVPWQTGLTSGAVSGEIIGLLFNGLFTDRIGYRKTILISIISFACFVFIAFFAINKEMLLAAQILVGIPWGVFQTLTTTYAAECLPTALRAYLTSSVNMCWLVGQVISLGVVRGFINVDNSWAYRTPFALQWVFAVPLAIVIAFAPESPWWLIRKERIKDARKVLLRLTRRNMEGFNVDETITMMRQTSAMERLTPGQNDDTSYLDCFKGTDLRRTEICCVVWMIQNLCGGALTGYAVYFFVQAGFTSERALDLSVGMYGLAIVAGIISWVLMRYFGRRTLYLAGCGGCMVVLLIGGAVGSGSYTDGVKWTMGGVIILLTFIYDLTIGPVCYSLVAEIPSARLRSKTVVLARVAYNICSITSNVLLPKMLSPVAWDWRGKACYLWAGTALLCLVWCWFRLPEPKGLTYLELNVFFSKKIDARKFSKLQANLNSRGYFEIGNPDAHMAWTT